MLCERGFALLKSGQVAEADACCRQALTQQPDCVDGLHLMGAIAVARRQYDHAVDWFAAALRQAPKPQYLLSLANALQLLGRLDEALKAYDKAVTLKPDGADLWNHMGFVLSKLDRVDDAILVFRHVLKLSPRHQQAAHMCAMLLFEKERFDEAVTCFDLCAKLEPTDADVFQSRGVCHWRLSRIDLAAADFDRSVALEPDRVSFLINKGLAATAEHRFDDAFAAYNRALAVDPDSAAARWQLSLLDMLTGDFAAGWIGREARWRADVGMVERNFAAPLWLGHEPIAGMTILLHPDEGLGDAIQFSRYVPMVAALGARVVLEAEPLLYPLLSRLPGVSQSVLRGAALPQFDRHCPLASLPLAFQTRLETIPAPVSCLPAIPQELRDQWDAWLGPHHRPRVGLAWSGNPRHANDHFRSTTLQALSPLLDLDASFVSLQKDLREQDRILLCERPEIMDASGRLTDFLAAAALVSCLDLVITVDTSIAHLAGTVGCPVWIMLPFAPDYRWLLDREDSPWYPTARLFRQTATRDYAPVVERVKGELHSLIAAGHPSPRVTAGPR